MFDGKRLLLVVTATALMFAGSFESTAGESPIAYRNGSKDVALRETVFDQGQRELQVLVGTFASFTHSPDFDYAVGSIRLGWMLNSQHGSGCLRGNCEFLIEAFGGGIYEGPGSYLGGATLLLRYNFVQPDARLVPYFQLGAGGLYSDAAKDEDQRLIGNDLEFNLQASIGARWFLNERTAIVIEGGYRHISNANLSDRNLGVDSLGGHLGLSWFF
jgi:lipid A 3-O-deacylase